MAFAQKAHAIRQLSRDATQSSMSTSNSSSSFDITGDPLMSTRPFEDDIFEKSVAAGEDTRDSLPTMPHIRSTAKKLGAWQPYNPMADPKVTSSAVRKEFRDFDQGSEFDNDTQVSDFTEDSISVEHNRGLKRGSRNTPQHLNSSFAMSPVPLHDSLYDVTPPAKRSARNTPQQKSPLADASLRRDVPGRRASGSPAGATLPARPSLAANQRKTTLSQVHQMVTDDEHSVIDDQPPTVTLTKATRFSSTRSRQEPAQQQSTFARKSQQPVNNTPRSIQNTAQSFILPDLPNLTELVSGVFEDGTPIFNRHTRPRSHFSAPAPAGRQPNYNRIDSVPIPAEEKAIFASLQLLQEKVAQLEQEKAEADKRMEEQENEIVEMRAAQDAQDRMRRPDSGLGSTDGEGTDKRGWRVEKLKLESSMNTLRTKLDRAERKVSVADISTKRATSERDNLVTQLGVAYFNIEEVKAEREALLAENEELHIEVDDLRAENEQLRDRLGEVGEVHTQNEVLRQQLANETAKREQERHAKRDAERHAKREQERQARREEKLEAQRQAKQGEERQAKEEEARRAQEDERQARREVERQFRREAREPHDRREKDTQARISDRVQQELRNSKVFAAAQSVQTRPRSSRYASSRFQSESQRAPVPKVPARSVSNPEPAFSRRRLEADEEPQSTTDLSLTNLQTGRFVSDGRSGMPEFDAQPIEPPPFDLTDLSFIKPEDIANIRRQLEEERAETRRQRASAPPTQTREDTVRSIASAKSGQPQLIHGMSTRDVTARSNFTAHTEHTADFTSRSNRSINTQPQQTEDSFVSHASRRRRSAPVEETSGFIVPDITMGAQKHTINFSKLNLPASAAHDNKSCTVCARQNSQTTSPKIPRPVPVSTRTADDADATMRPTQPPRDALARVLKELKDELTHLHLELAAHEALLSAHDPSLGRRERKSIQDAMTDILARIDIKSDQIYNLYDVVEGHKADDMTEQEIEDTLRSITAKAKSNAAAKGRKVVVESHHSDGESDDAEDAELPFEGFSDTDSLPVFGRSDRVGVF